MRRTITVARGDGIGPEITDATLKALDACGADLDIEEVELGEAVYRRGFSAGIAPESWASIRRTGVLLKAPITTPQGGGVKSLNVTLRKSLGLFANVRPCVSYAPWVPTRHPGINCVIVRENEEDLYAGIEHRQTPEVVQCLKLITRPGSERVIRYAFEYARRKGRQRVTAMVKDNIMKLTDGLFARTFAEVAREYPEIEAERMIVDIGAARLADTPERFDVVVLPNLYGDILSDVAAQISGSVGLCGSANIGEHGAMFEAVHGSAPDIAGQGVANPSGLLHAAILMLRHLGQGEAARRLQDAWTVTIEDGVHTADIHSAHSRARVGTASFVDAVIARLGEVPRRLPRAPASDEPLSECVVPAVRRPRPVKQTVGIDVFLDWDAPGRDPDALAAELSRADADGLALTMITNRGVKVWPDGLPETFCTDHWRCRFQTADGRPVGHVEQAALLHRIAELGLDWIKTEGLCTFDGEPGFSLGQGQ